MQIIGSYLFALYMPLLTLIAGVIALPTLIMGRRAALFAIRIWTRLILGGAKLLTGVEYRIEGEENLPKNGALIAANHQSQWETIVLFALLERPSLILKKELLRIPIYGWWALPSGNIPIDRDGGAKALRAMRNAAKDKIEEGAQVVLFPEGTRVQPGERRDYQPGVAGIYSAVNAPCVPIAHDSGRFWTHPGIVKKPGVITLRVLDPIAPGMNRKAFLQLLQDRIESARPDLDPAIGGERAS